MPDRVLTGTRVRNRRLDRKMRQADVAKQVGISASYLNLIEHNRRRIGGKVLSDLARVLDVDARLLEEETSASIMVPLKEAAAVMPVAGAEAARADELVARFPGWAQLVVAQAARIAQLEARVEALGDRLAHDTQIASSLHEVISTATAIRSTASILAETPDLDREWQARFHGNIDTDSERLAQSSQALLGFLDMETAPEGAAVGSAVEQAETYMAAHGYVVDGCEDQAIPDFAQQDPVVRGILTGWAKTNAEDAARLPYQPFLQAARQLAFDPARLAARLAVPLDLVLRRLAQLPQDGNIPPMGLARCDAAGVITFQRPVLDFRLPRAAAACPLWPLFQALSQPGRAIARTVRLPGPARTAFECFAIAGPVGHVSFSDEPRIEATMLVRPARTDVTPHTVGPGCRLCPVTACDSRRQPSVMQGTS